MLSKKKSHNPQVEVILCNKSIQRVSKAKFTGVIVDQYLKWKYHISMVSHKISKSSGIISHIWNTLGIKFKKKRFNIVSYTHIFCIVSISSPLPIKKNIKTL